MVRYLIAMLFLLAQTSKAITPTDSTISHFSILKPTVFTGGAIVISFLFDGAVHKRTSPVNWLDDVAHITDFAGEKTIIVPSLLLTYGLNRFVIKDKQFRKVSEASLKTVVVTAILTESLKIGMGRARPFTNQGPHSFQPFPGSRDQYKSLPSGHASLAFAVFTPFAEGYSRWIYVLPASVAAGRVIQNKHWVSDVVVGGGIGLLTGLLFYHHKNRVEPIPNGLVVYF